MSHLLRILFALAGTSFHVHAATVAFLELTKPDGEVVRLGDTVDGAAPTTHFAHVAVRIGTQWVHAYPGRPVEVIAGLGGISQKIVYLHNPDVPMPTLAQVQPWLGRKFDRQYRWDSEDATHCSRFASNLVAADIAPSPMSFAGETWRHAGPLPRGAMGLGPNKLFAELKKRHWREIQPCAEPLEIVTNQAMPIKFLYHSTIYDDAAEVLSIRENSPRRD